MNLPKFIRALQVVMAVLALALLQSCSAIKLAYNNAPEFGYWWMDAYLDFTDTQSLALRADLNRLQAWHRKEELPKIADLLQKTQRLMSADMTPGQVCGLFADVRERFNAVTAQAEGPVLTLAATLQPDQFKHLERKFAKNNDEYRSDWLNLPAKERLDKRVKSNAERSEEFYGKLEERQLATLRSALETSAFDVQVGFADRLRRQQDMLQTLRLMSGNTATGSGNINASLSPKPSPAESLALLRGYLDRSVNSPNPAYRAYSDRLTQDSCAGFARLHNSTTPEQRERAVRRLAAYERDARELAAQR